MRVYELLEAALQTSLEGDAGKECEIRKEGELKEGEQEKAKLWILADTSYSPCCVDAVAAEHVNAEVVVHYGNACLSEVKGVDVLYVYTWQSMDVAWAVERFEDCFAEAKSDSEEVPDVENSRTTRKEEKVVLMADCVYQSNVPSLLEMLREKGWSNVFGTEIMHGPEELIPNRKVYWQEAEERDLKEYSIFYIGNPPASLLLTLSTKVKDLFVCPISSFTSPAATRSVRQHTQIMLRKRYALLTSLTTAPIIGILINTLSLTNLIPTIGRIKKMIERAEKKSYTVVVGKVNVEKLANFSEVGGWVGVGCWESGLGVREGDDEDVAGAGGVTASGGFWKPVITPFELGLVLQSDRERIWGGEWKGGLDGLRDDVAVASTDVDGQTNGYTNGTLLEEEEHSNSDIDHDPDSEPESAPPDFDLRTGRYIAQSISRPMKRPTLPIAPPDSLPEEATEAPTATLVHGEQLCSSAGPSSDHYSPPISKSENSADEEAGKALARRPKQELSSALVNGIRSPAAEFLREKRTWTGLGSDFTGSGNEDGGEGDGGEGAGIEEGRRGVARGYVVGDGMEGEVRR